ncbi:MAG: hypothetical protein IBX39_05895, partial [Candidatus Methanoperedenaceae archaeon]|nr:hypothetical protein [Candidatus Methanoperedenaceae archaeon]
MQSGINLSTDAQLFLIVNIVLLVIAVILFLRLRKLKKEGNYNKQKEHDLSGIADIKPEDINLDRLGLKPEDMVFTKKKKVKAEEKTANMDDLKLEDVVPVKEEGAKTGKKPVIKRSDVKKTGVEEVKTGKKPVIKKSDVEKTGVEEAKTGKKPVIKKSDVEKTGVEEA